MVDAIPTQVHGVVMVTKGYPVYQLQHSKYYQLKSFAPPQVIPEKAPPTFEKEHFKTWKIPVCFLASVDVT